MKAKLLVVAVGVCACAPRATTTPETPRPVLTAPAEVGMQPAVLARIDSIVAAGLADRAAPGAAVAVGRHGKLIKLQGYGRLDYRPGFGAATESSIYDLAS